MTTLHTWPDLVQRSPEWYAARCGVVTASVVGKLLTTRTPGPIDFALDYACPDCAAPADNPCVSRTRKTPTPIKIAHDARIAVAAQRVADVAPIIEVADNDTSRGITETLAAERITGWVEETPITSDMWRGIECEPFARDVYANHFAPVTEVGFMRLDADGWQLGYSPDGLVGDDGLIEVKAYRAKTHLHTILADEMPAYHMAQCQAGLLVTGRKWIDFVSYVGGMPLYVKRIEPDPAWFAAITATCIAFEANAARIVADYNERTAGMPRTDRIDLELKVA
jgi:hypothetical protein